MHPLSLVKVAILTACLLTVGQFTASASSPKPEVPDPRRLSFEPVAKTDAFSVEMAHGTGASVTDADGGPLEAAIFRITLLRPVPEKEPQVFIHAVVGVCSARTVVVMGGISYTPKGDAIETVKSPVPLQVSSTGTPAFTMLKHLCIDRRRHLQPGYT